MRITPSDQIGNLPPGTNVEAVQGKLLKIYEYKSGSNDKGSWSLQNLKVQDAAGTYTVVLKNRPELGTDWGGIHVVFVAGQDKNRPKGVMIDEYQGKTRILVSDHATMEESEPERQTRGGGQQQAPQQTRQQPPPQTRQQAPQPRQQSLQEEERQEQERARPDSQRTQQEPRQQQAPVQQRQQREEKTPEERLQNGKREMLKLASLYVLSHDAAVLIASSIYSRHGQAMHPAGVGSLATTLFIEANKRNIGGPLPAFDIMKNPAPMYKLSDIVAAFEEHQAELAQQPAPVQNDSTSPEALAQQPDKEW